jgi:hypothetical protein
MACRQHALVLLRQVQRLGARVFVQAWDRAWGKVTTWEGVSACPTGFFEIVDPYCFQRWRTVPLDKVMSPGAWPAGQLP